MLDKLYINSLIHYIDVLKHREQTKRCLEELNTLDYSKFGNYYYQLEIIEVLKKCKRLSMNLECIEIYIHILKGLEMEVIIGAQLN